MAMLVYQRVTMIDLGKMVGKFWENACTRFSDPPNDIHWWFIAASRSGGWIAARFDHILLTGAKRREWGNDP